MYTYDRRIKVATRDRILEMICDLALRDRPFESLIHAYVDELREDFIEDEVESDAESEWESVVKRTFTEGEHAVEDRLLRTYTKIYRSLIPWATKENAGEVFELPERTPTHIAIPNVILDALAVKMAKRDAREAKALRDEMLRIRQP